MAPAPTGGFIMGCIPIPIPIGGGTPTGGGGGWFISPIESTRATQEPSLLAYLPPRTRLGIQKLDLLDSLRAPGKRRNLPQGTQRKGLKDNLQKSSPLFSSYLLSMALSRLGRSSGNRTNARFCNLVAARGEKRWRTPRLRLYCHANFFVITPLIANHRGERARELCENDGCVFANGGKQCSLDVDLELWTDLGSWGCIENYLFFRKLY